ncbi:MAG: transglycosylase SLT domain-containing protein [Candidatus Dormibacteria bacterium]
MGLVALTALQPVAQDGRLGVDSFALARHLASPSVTTAASTPAAPAAPTPTAIATPTPLLPVPTPLPTAVPTPKPAPVVRAPAPPASTGTSSSGGDIEAIITAAAQAAGVAPSWLISTAECESGLNPNAYNRSGPYDGLFQFLPSTFAAHGGTNIWDPTQQAQIAATMFASGESGEWPVCSR